MYRIISVYVDTWFEGVRCECAGVSIGVSRSTDTLECASFCECGHKCMAYWYGMYDVRSN